MCAAEAKRPQWADARRKGRIAADEQAENGPSTSSLSCCASRSSLDIALRSIARSTKDLSRGAAGRAQAGLAVRGSAAVGLWEAAPQKLVVARHSGGGAARALAQMGRASTRGMSWVGRRGARAPSLSSSGLLSGLPRLLRPYVTEPT